MSFVNSAWAWIALFASLGLALIFALDFTRRRRLLERIGNLPMLSRMTPSLSRSNRLVKAVLFIVGITLLLLSIGGPLGKGQTTWKLRGIDVAIVMDFSKSMMARDIRPSRHDKMLKTSEDLIGDLKGSRLAMILFSGAAVQFPLSHDHQAAMLLYQGVTPLDMAPGSDLGEAIRIGRCVLRPDVKTEAGCDRIGGRGRGGDPLDPTATEEEEEAELKGFVGDEAVADRARAIVVFTDGQDTEGNAKEEVELAASLGIHIFFVGVGTPAGELIPDFDRRGREVGWKKHPDGSFVRTRLDQTALKELAAIGSEKDNRYFQLGTGRFDLPSLVGELDDLKKGDLEKRHVQSSVPIFQMLLFPAFLLLLIEACMGERRRVR